MNTEDITMSLSDGGLQSCVAKAEKGKTLPRLTEGLEGTLEPERCELVRTSGSVWVVRNQSYVAQADTIQARTAQMAT